MKQTARSRLRRWLDCVELSGRALADDLGVKPASVSQWLSGKNIPSEAMQIAIEKRTGIKRDAWPAFNKRTPGGAHARSVRTNARPARGATVQP